MNIKSKNVEQVRCKRLDINVIPPWHYETNLTYYTKVRCRDVLG